MAISSEQLREIQYRLLLAKHKCVPGTAENGEPRESVLHEFILDECRRRGWIALHGSMAHRTKRTLAEPDFTILADRRRVFFIECKGAATKISYEQACLHAHAKVLGHRVHIVRSKDAVVELFSEPYLDAIWKEGESCPGFNLIQI